MSEEQIVQQIGNRLRELPFPEASPFQLTRIAARVAAGDQVMLETDQATQATQQLQPRFSHPMVLALVCAAAVVVAVGATLGRIGRDDPRSVVDPETPAGSWSAAPFGVSTLAAQSIRPGSPRIGLIDAARLPTGRWVYASQPIGGTVTAEIGRIDTATIERVVLDGRRAYAITWRWGSKFKDGRMADSVYATTIDLTPLRRVFQTRGGSTVAMMFTDDSVTRTWSKPDGTVEHLAVGLSGAPEWRQGVTLVGEQEWALFPLVLLQRGWHGHVAVMALVNTGNLATLWTGYRVSGEARITVPAGTFDCWAVRYEGSWDGSPAADFTRWIDKRTGWLIKEGLTSNRFGREHVLLSYEAGK